MRVAYDCHSLLTSPTGVARYTRQLGDALEKRGVTLARYAIGWSGAPPAGVRRLRLPNPIVHRMWPTVGIPRVRRMTGAVDLVHGTEFVLPPLGDTPGVVTVHDLSFLRDDAYPGAKRYRHVVPWSVRRARRVLVPSETVAAEVAAGLDAPVDRIVVTYEGVADAMFDAAPLTDDALAALGLRRPFALALGELQPRKNFPLLLDAWGRARQSLGGWTLAVAGPAGWGPSLPAAPDVTPLGFVPDDVLPGLLAAAELFCFPSLYEGFGLPPHEAMAAGTAVVAGRYPAATELLGDAARLVDQTDADAFAAAIVELATDDATRAQLAARGRARAASFTWDRAAELTIAAYEDALAAS